MSTWGGGCASQHRWRLVGRAKLCVRDTVYRSTDQEVSGVRAVTRFLQALHRKDRATRTSGRSYLLEKCAMLSR